MRPSRIKAKLRKGEAALLTLLHFTDPSVYEMTSRMGFDGIWMDLEHHAFSLETAGALMRAARVGTSDIMARPAKGEFVRAARMLEAGAQGLMYPRCQSADEARELVRNCKFAPLGERGFDGGNPDMPYCTMDIATYIRRSNNETFLMVQLEDPIAVENAEEIARVEGIDVIFFGPGDFTVLSGIPGQFEHKRVTEALRYVAASAKKAGKHWGSTTGGPEHSRKLLDLGARLLCHGADIIMVKSGLEAIQRNYAELGFSFQNEFTGAAKSYIEQCRGA